eukprot:284819198_4
MDLLHQQHYRQQHQRHRHQRHQGYQRHQRQQQLQQRRHQRTRQQQWHHQQRLQRQLQQPHRVILRFCVFSDLEKMSCCWGLSTRAEFFNPAFLWARVFFCFGMFIQLSWRRSPRPALRGRRRRRRRRGRRNGQINHAVAACHKSTTKKMFAPKQTWKKKKKKKKKNIPYPFTYNILHNLFLGRSKLTQVTPERIPRASRPFLTCLPTGQCEVCDTSATRTCAGSSLVAAPRVVTMQGTPFLWAAAIMATLSAI